MHVAYMRQCSRNNVPVFTLSLADKELEAFPNRVKEKIAVLVGELRDMGSLRYPHSRRLQGYDLYEMRLKEEDGIYRVIYCYTKVGVVILSGFKKKTQKTPIKEIKKALGRKDNISY